MELARSNLLITNDIITRHYVKGPRVVYLQTWHGSSIKLIGLDESTPKYRRGNRHLKLTLRDVGKWDYLLSPSKVHSELFRRAFGYEGEILEFGYPRNDILVNDDGTKRSEIRRLLGISPDQLVVLYAPTWRDDAHLPSSGFFQPQLIDWDELFSALPEGTVVLYRVHQNVVAQGLPKVNGNLIEVSQHDDVSELILASDALVSDYSSLTYDYAVYGRPIILHAPDLEHYRDSVRGFYFDLESWAPGPITSTTAELGELLSSLDDVKRSYEKRYLDFVGTHCTFEDGTASRRVAELLVDRHLR